MRLPHLKLHFTFLYLIVLGTFVLMLLMLHRTDIAVEKITEPHEIKLPHHVRERLLQQPNYHLLYIDYQKRSIRYYYPDYNPRVGTVLNALRQIARSLRYKIPHGQYLLILHDNGNFDFEVPFLAFAAPRHMVDSGKVILMPDIDALAGYTRMFLKLDSRLRQYPWRKKIPKIFWRGSATGAGSDVNDLDGFPRIKFLNRAKTLDFIDAGFTDYTHQFNPEFGAKVKLAHPLKGKVSPEQSIAYKYLIDIDGNSCSYSRLAWILYSNSLVMKHESDEIQWYYSQLQPYVHYLPIARDFSNLQTQFAWAQDHPDEALKIAKNGREVAKRIFTSANIMQSMAEAFTTYARLNHDN